MADETVAVRFGWGLPMPKRVLCGTSIPGVPFPRQPEYAGHLGRLKHLSTGLRMLFSFDSRCSDNCRKPSPPSSYQPPELNSTLPFIQYNHSIVNEKRAENSVLHYR